MKNVKLAEKMFSGSQFLMNRSVYMHSLFSQLFHGINLQLIPPLETAINAQLQFRAFAGFAWVK